jgi:hypothetical protein
MLHTALLTLKYIFRDDLRERLPEILGLLRELEQKFEWTGLCDHAAALSGPRGEHGAAES